MDICNCFGVWNSCPKFIRNFQLHLVTVIHMHEYNTQIKMSLSPNMYVRCPWMRGRMCFQPTCYTVHRRERTRFMFWFVGVGAIRRGGDVCKIVLLLVQRRPGDYPETDCRMTERTDIFLTLLPWDFESRFLFKWLRSSAFWPGTLPSFISPRGIRLPLSHHPFFPHDFPFLPCLETKTSFDAGGDMRAVCCGLLVPLGPLGLLLAIGRRSGWQNSVWIWSLQIVFRFFAPTVEVKGPLVATGMQLFCGRCCDEVFCLVLNYYLLEFATVPFNVTLMTI
jgi:hypothetical protein